MILRLFRSNQPALALLLPLVGLICWLPAWWLNQPPDFSTSPLSFLQLGAPSEGRIWIIIAFLWVLFGAFQFNQLFQQYDLIERRNQLPGMCFVLAFSWSPFLMHYSHLLPAIVFMLFAIRRLMVIYRQHMVIRELFDVGLFIGLAALFYAPFILFLLACWISLIVLRPFSLREWFIPLTGIMTIGILFFGLNYLFEWQAIRFLIESWHPIDPVYPVGIFGWFKYVIAAILLLMTVVATPSFTAALTRSTMRDRNLKMILLIFGLITGGQYLLILFLPDFGSNVMLLAFPVSMMLVYAVADKKVNWMISGLFYALLISAIINNYGMLWVT